MLSHQHSQKRDGVEEISHIFLIAQSFYWGGIGDVHKYISFQVRRDKKKKGQSSIGNLLESKHGLGDILNHIYLNIDINMLEFSYDKQLALQHMPSGENIISSDEHNCIVYSYAFLNVRLRLLIYLFYR